MSTADDSNIHRHLDEAFSGIVMTPELQDLKEEIRGNLAARVNELTASGLDERSAAATAIEELGDIHEVVSQFDATDTPAQPRTARNGGTHNGTAPGGAARGGAAQSMAAYQVYRVRPKPAFVVGIVVAAIAVVVGLLLGAFGALGVLPLPLGPIIGLNGIAATGVAWIVGDSLAHETTTNHPMPTMRASGYFLASFLAVYGLGFAALVALGTLPVWAIVFAAIGVVAAIVLFAFLGATQTNRKKTWVREAAREYQVEDRFTLDPAAAARFGIYTVVLWLLAFAAFAVVSITVGFLWSWLALLVGCAAFMFMLARMLFPPDKTGPAAGPAASPDVSADLNAEASDARDSTSPRDNQRRKGRP